MSITYYPPRGNGPHVGAPGEVRAPHIDVTAEDVGETETAYLDAEVVIGHKRIYSSAEGRLAPSLGVAPRPQLAFYGNVGTSQHVDLTNVLMLDFSNVLWANQSYGAWKGVTSLGSGYKDENVGAARPYHGMNGYIQNNTENLKTFDGCIFGPSYSDTPFKVFTQGSSFCRHIRFRDCVTVGGWMIFGGDNFPTDDIEIERCCFVDSYLALGWQEPQNGSILVSDSWMGGFAALGPWTSVRFLNNVVFPVQYEDEPAAYRNVMILQQSFAGWEWDGNTYYADPGGGSLANLDCFALEGVGILNFSEWKAATGFDAHSQLLPLSEAPLQSRILPVNAGEHVANVAVWNHPADASFALSLTGMNQGHYELRPIQAYDTDRRAFNWVLNPVTVALDGLYVAPVGAGAEMPAWMAKHTPGIFVAELWRV